MAQCWSNIVKQPAMAPPPPGLYQSPVDSSVGNCKSSKGVAVAVVDANAVIHGGERLYSSGDKFVTVPEVAAEVRDPVSRHRLDIAPVDIEPREPSPEALKKVINFARATGDLQTLSDVDLKLIALTYTLEAQIHGTKHIRDSPPPIHTVNVKRLPEKDMPGWGSNVPNLEEWEALEDKAEDKSNPDSRILPLQDINLNAIPSTDHLSTEEGSVKIEIDSPISNQEDANGSFRKPRKYFPKKKEINIEGKKVADGIDASQGQLDDNDGDFQPAVSRSTRRRFIKRQARRQSEILSDKDTVDTHQDALEEKKHTEEKSGDDLSGVLNEMRLEENSSGQIQQGDELCEEAMVENTNVGFEGEETEYVVGGSYEEAMVGNNGNVGFEGEVAVGIDEDFDHLEISSQTNESLDASCADDKSSEQSWMLRPLSESSVACVTSDFAMQNVILQMGLRLLAPGGMQIRQLHRWILKCHACYKVTTDIGRIFCPSCGNGGTLRKVAVTVGENGIVLSARRPRISVRGTKFSLPLPQGGRDAITKNPVLREDQLPQKFIYPKTKKKNKQGEDIFASNDLFHHHTDKRAPLQPPVRKALAVFSGKRNPNDNHYSRAKH